MLECDGLEAGHLVERSGVLVRAGPDGSLRRNLAMLPASKLAIAELDSQSRPSKCSLPFARCKSKLAAVIGNAL